ncbi:hypothetical protein [Streptomyces sp. BRA346]|uniref:hypothetical protein n=1 Tax=Streptomyces sp. BRA346 TaxID=2878199 RepID=UPI0040642B5F
MLERAALTSPGLFEGVQTWLVGHPLLVAVTVAALAVVAQRTVRCRLAFFVHNIPGPDRE